MFRVVWSRFPLEQRHKSILQNVLGLAVAQAERASVQDQLARAGVVHTLAPGSTQ
jgi:hypothetical protein